MPWSLGGQTLSEGEMFSEVFVFVFLGMRGLLARAHTNPEPIRLHTKCFNPLAITVRPNSANVNG